MAEENKSTTVEFGNIALTLSKNMGKELISEALKEYKEKKVKQVVAQVSILMERVDHMQQIIEKATKRLELTQKQLAAINAGEFTVKEKTGELKYNDPELMVTWDSTERW